MGRLGLPLRPAAVPHAGARPVAPARWRSWVRRAALAALTGLVILMLALAVAWQLTPSVGDLRQRIAAHLAAHGAQPLAQLPSPDRVGQAIIATEDSRFYQHPGVDALGLGRALLAPLLGQGDLGGAALDQQLAKVVYTPDASGVATKAEDAVLALKIDQAYPKEEILRDYLSAVYFGHGYYGVDAASRGYFARSPGQLSWAQASLLAGLVQAPSSYDPIQHLPLARQRQRLVLDRLVATGVLTQAAADAAYHAPLGLRTSARRG